MSINKSQLIFSLSFQNFSEIHESLVIVDRKLKNNNLVQNLIKQSPAVYWVQAGEILKEINFFPKHISKILTIVNQLNVRSLHIVAIGGGSVGDFAGFVSSVLRRGVPLIQIPSTWLAAIDSAHGGKNALNAGDAKNQIGTFHLAKKIIIIKKLLESQPIERAREASGELIKMAFIDGGSWAKELLRNESEKDSEFLWRYLRPAITAKNRIVNKDFKEQKGYRRILNLGHTVGHIIESAWKIPHGDAVAIGLYFALFASYKKGFISLKKYILLNLLLQKHLKVRNIAKPNKLSKAQFFSRAIKDKKKINLREVDFIFLKDFGRPVRQKIELTDLYKLFLEYRWRDLG